MNRIVLWAAVATVVFSLWSSELSSAQNRSLYDLAAAMWNHLPGMVERMRELAETGNSNEGRKLLDTKGCLSCHSLDGRGGKVADDLGQVKGFDSLSNVISALWNHIAIPQYIESQRTAWPQFLPREMADLEAFFQEVGRSRR